MLTLDFFIIINAIWLHELNFKISFFLKFLSDEFEFYNGNKGKKHVEENAERQH